MQEKYIPGVCNIWKSEINLRRQFGWGLFNLGEEAGKTDTVEQAEFRSMDRRKANNKI